MNTLKKKSGAIVLVTLCLVAASAAAAVTRQQLASRLAAGRPEVKVLLAGAVARSGELLALEKAGAVRPGEVLDWKIVSTNEGDGAARQYKAVGHVPQGTSFVAGSATAEYGAQVTYSIDGGKSFSPQPTLEEKQADGAVKRVPAPASLYTEVRYEWSDPLNAGATLTANYKVRVK